MQLTLDQALQKGIEAHKAGKVQEADRYYTAILKADPKHPDANHNMGILAVGVGKVEEALSFFKTALEINPNINQFWLSYIDALIKLDQLDEAKEVFETAKTQVAKGDGFGQIEQSLAGLEKDAEVNAASKKLQEPPKNQLQCIAILYTLGQYQEALNEATKLLIKFPNSIKLYNIIGAANQGLGKLDKAIKAYKKALSIKPDYAEAYNNMGLALQNKGKLDEAIEAYKKALSIKPDNAEAYYNMGNTLNKQGKLEEAIEVFKKALAIKPDYAEVYINLGNTLNKQGKLDEAIKAFTTALAIKPDYAEAHNSVGNVLQEQRQLDEAMEAYTKALSIKPHYAEAYNNMGNALKKQGKLEEAIEAINKALSIKPDYAEAFTNMGLALYGIVLNKPNRDLQNTIVSLLDQGRYARPSDIAKAAISLLKLEPTMQKHLQLGDVEVIESPLDVISDLREFPLLMKLMSVCPLPDLELEGLFTKLRCSILSNISSLRKASPELIGVQSALALQCFTNEYIYSHTEKEEKDLRGLEQKVKKDFKINKQPSPQVVLALAAYKALNQYDWYHLLIVTDVIKEVCIHQIEEPNEEEKLKKQIPILEEITDSVSSKVRTQYEESPYPRWVNLGLPLKPLSILNVVGEIKLKLYDNKITDIEKPDILIAGCGTGQHSIGTAARFGSSKVLAIDLSLSSLAYAKRKTEKLGIESIEHMQADILDLGKLNKQFDIIESAGVLHHMNDPMAGWKVLTDCLKPDGLMRIGLYSELARQDIVKIRDEISNTGIGSSDATMKSFRTMVMTSDQNHHKRILNSPDFYSLSTLKDLLFHVQEHRFTIPQLQQCLGELGLKFCGFEDPQIVLHFQQTNTHKDDSYNLNKWRVYEEANPQAFAGMYQFWCQKVD